MKLGFEALVAARYLRADRKKTARWPRYLSLGMAILTVVWTSLYLLCNHLLRQHYDARLFVAKPVLYAGIYVCVFFFVWTVFFVELIRRLTIFSTLSIFGLFVGSQALVIVLSVMSGFEQDLKRKILGTHAHMTITTPDRSFSDYRDVLKKVEKVPSVVAGTPYLTSEVMLASSSNLSGVIIKGIDPESIGKVTDLVKNTDVGSLDNLLHPEKLRGLGLLPPPPKPPEPPKQEEGGDDANGAEEVEVEKAPPPRPQRRLLPGVVLGRELAKNLRVFLGDDVNVVSPMGDIGPSGPIPKAKPFRVAAIFFSGMYEYDSKYIYMSMQSAQKFLGLSDEVTGIELKLADPERSEEVALLVKGALGAGPDGQGYLVEDWKKLNYSLFSALKLEKIAMFIVLCFIILVAAFSIIANGIMLVMEKAKEMAILKAVGSSDQALLRVFLLLGFYMGLLGIGVGICTGMLECKGLDYFGLPLNTDVYYITKLPVNVSPKEVFAVFAASLLLTLSATLYPAWRASKLRPVEALR